MTESQIRYLRTIRSLKAPVRSRDIVTRMQVSKPSVSRMVKQLKSAGLIRTEEKNVIVISPRGQEVLEEYNRRIEQVIEYLRENLDVCGATAEEGAFVWIGNLKQAALDEICKKIEFSMDNKTRI